MPPQRLLGIACELDIADDLVHRIMGVVHIKGEAASAQAEIELIEAYHQIHWQDEEMTTAQRGRLHQETSEDAMSIEEAGIEVQIATMVVDEVDQGRPTIEIIGIGVVAQGVGTWTMKRIYPFHCETRGMCQTCK